MFHIQESIIFVLFAVFIATGWLQQQAVDKWTQQTGRAPMIQKGRGSWAVYMRATEHEMPVELRKRIALLKWVCYLALLSMLVVGAIQGILHRH
jgi:hypothetical protein